ASSERVEQLFAALAAALKANGFTRFIVAGGETSSIVAQTLGVEALMNRPPRKTGQHVMDGFAVWRVAFVGSMIAIAAFILEAWL
ncbi:nucleotide-binding domain containing protein, partial [Klebsiella pneumoniae]|uniref:nucleotide-binding domain containing protein n=1 Tax=Klebsiella pneumoniae TaxID=573 RepID=UPI0023F85E64